MTRPMLLTLIALSVTRLSPAEPPPQAVQNESPDLRTAGVFGDHMVLQRGREVPVWGWDTPGQAVAVSFGGASATGMAGEDGKWLVRLPIMGTSKTPREMTIRGSQTLTLRDILVGDVWICSGQSNMGRDVSRSCRPQDMSMDYPLIRCCAVRAEAQRYPQQDAETEWWPCVGEGNVLRSCAVGFFFARRVRQEVEVPIGLLWTAWAGSYVAEWMSPDPFRSEPELKPQSEEIDALYPETAIGNAAWQERLDEYKAWQAKAEQALANGTPFPHPQPRMPEATATRAACCFFNGKVLPLVPFAVKGLLWYQGENDKGNRQYALMLRAMVADWQRRFVNGDRFPVYFMQLQRSGDYCSPLIREEQFRAVAIPDSGMAVLMDLDVNVHPVNKFDSGERLALWALSKDYGKTGIVCSGPLYKGYEIKADKITISFDYAEGGLRLGTKEMMDPPVFDPEGTMTNVEIRGEKSRNWVKARTRIEGDKLIAWSPEVAAPVAARYCYENTPAGPFLYTPAGLPAAQFSTETKELQ